MAESTRITSLSVLLDQEPEGQGKMLLKEAYDGAFANFQKDAISTKI